VLRVVRRDEYNYCNNQQCRCISTSKRTDHIIPYHIIPYYTTPYHLISYYMISPQIMSYTNLHSEIRFCEDVPADMTVGLAVMSPEEVGAASGAAGSKKGRIQLL
jgi:hypothetical protein